MRLTNGWLTAHRRAISRSDQLAHSSSCSSITARRQHCYSCFKISIYPQGQVWHSGISVRAGVSLLPRIDFNAARSFGRPAWTRAGSRPSCRSPRQRAMVSCHGVACSARRPSARRIARIQRPGSSSHRTTSGEAGCVGQPPCDQRFGDWPVAPPPRRQLQPPCGCGGCRLGRSIARSKATSMTGSRAQFTSVRLLPAPQELPTLSPTKKSVCRPVIKIQHRRVTLREGRNDGNQSG
jgi:hypothetical protein